MGLNRLVKQATITYIPGTPGTPGRAAYCAQKPFFDSFSWKHKVGVRAAGVAPSRYSSGGSSYVLGLGSGATTISNAGVTSPESVYQVDGGNYTLLEERV